MKRKKGRGKRTYKERSGWTNRHHIRPTNRGGKSVIENLIRLDEMRHAAFHLLFKNMTFLEAADLLVRADEMKRRLSSVHKSKEVS